MKGKSLVVGISALFIAGCGVADEEPLTTVQSELTVPGPWAPPATTVAIAATQYVPVVDPPPVSPLGSCTSSNAFACSCSHPECSPAHTGTVELDRFLRQKFPYLRSGGLYCCRQNSATTSVPKLSVHAVGRAIDLMVTLENGDANNGLGDPVANWLVENAEFIGIQRVIWDRKFWNGERGFGNLSPNSLSHTNHLHVELSKAGAAKLTPFFTSGASAGVCQERCEGTRIINKDCSTGDCAFYGATCTPGSPPKCTQPPPPEPPEAVRVGNASFPSMRMDGPPGRVNFFTPRRLFDTRSASTNVTRGDGSNSGPLTSTGENKFSITGLPAGSTAAWLNLAAVQPQDPGFLSVYATDGSIPITSSLNYVPGQVKANAVPIDLGTNNGVTITTLQDVNVVADLTASFASTGDGMDAVVPTRVLDTRASSPIRKDTVTEIDVRAPAGSTGVVATVAVINQGENPGFLTAFPCGAPNPQTSNINYAGGVVTANTVLSKLSANRRLCVESTEEVDLVVDVGGYFSPDGPLSYQPLVSRRILDTRQSSSYYKNRLGDRQVIELPIQDIPNMPDAIWSVATNVTVVGATQQGHLTTFPCGANIPNTSSLNFQPDDPVASLNVSRVGMNGNLCIFASSRAHVIVDVVGVWKHIASLQPTAPTVQTDPADEGDTVDPADPQIPGNGEVNNGTGGTNNGTGGTNNGTGGTNNGSGDPNNGTGDPNNGTGDPNNGTGDPNNGTGDGTGTDGEDGDSQTEFLNVDDDGCSAASGSPNTPLGLLLLGFVWSVGRRLRRH